MDLSKDFDYKYNSIYKEFSHYECAYGKYEVQLYVGHNSSEDYSFPNTPNLDINDYESFTIQIREGFNLLNYDELTNIGLDFDGCKQVSTARYAYVLVPKNIIEKAILHLKKLANINTDSITETAKDNIITGGNCHNCGCYDGYSPQINGKFTCYKCYDQWSK